MSDNSLAAELKWATDMLAAVNMGAKKMTPEQYRIIKKATQNHYDRVVKTCMLLASAKA